MFRSIVVGKDGLSFGEHAVALARGGGGSYTELILVGSDDGVGGGTLPIADTISRADDLLVIGSRGKEKHHVSPRA